jgi:hypothetical protein
MGQIKNRALKKVETDKFTLNETQMDVLMHYRGVAQQNLDRLLQELTSVYLHSLAVSEFGYKANDNLGFKLELEKSEDNITITNLG